MLHRLYYSINLHVCISFVGGFPYRTSKCFETRGDLRSYVFNTEYPPYNAIAFIKVTSRFGDTDGRKQQYMGTAFAVQDFHNRKFLLTAAHNICELDEEDNALKSPDGTFQIMSDISIIFGYNKYSQSLKAESVELEPNDFVIHPKFNTGGDEFDIAIYEMSKLATSKLPKAYFRMDMQITADKLKWTQTFISGYPKDVYNLPMADPRRPPGTMWGLSCKEVTIDGRYCCYVDATSAGNSGSPLYYQTYNEDNQCVSVVFAVHVGCSKVQNSNKGVMIRSEFFDKTAVIYCRNSSIV